jgi:hypothetical protein
MTYDDPIKPESQDLDTGMLVRILRATNVSNITNKLQPYGASPMTGRPLVGKNVGTVMGFEGGTGISVTNSTEKYGKKSTLLRRALRIDKKPWPNGQRDIRVRVTVKHGQTIGNNGTTAIDKVYIKEWNRNVPFDYTFESNEAPTNAFLTSNGFGPCKATVTIKLEPRGVGPGLPLVWNDENPMSETYTTCFWSNPSFTHGGSISMLGGPPYTRSFPIPNPQWIKHRLNFSDGYVGVKYNPGNPLGVVMGVTVTVEAVGWDTGWHDLEGWHSETGGDDYQIPEPNSYEYPNYPISDPFNPTGPGVG